MDLIYWNLLLLLLLILLVIWMHYFGSKPESFENFANFANFAPLPYFHVPLLQYFDNEPSGYDAGTRGYYNPNFANEVAQGLDTR